MITNSSITIYHKSGLDVVTRNELWTRYNYDNANDVQIRIPFDLNPNLDISNFSIGDIVIQGTLTTDIETQQDLDNYLFYNITTIKNNNFGNNPHIHIGGK